MKELLKRLDDVSRRDFLANVAKTFLGVSLLPIGGAAMALGAPEQLRRAAKAKSIIYLFMEGGMSHLDTFDPKPDRKDIQGPVGAIDTNVAGIRVTEYLPQLAQQMDKLAVIRSMSHTQGNHEPGKYKLRTGYEEQSGIAHPALGAWITRLSERENPNLPAYIRVGGLGGHPASGFFDSKFAPLPISNPQQGLPNSRLPQHLTQERFDKNLKLAQQLNAGFQQRYQHKDVQAYGDYYADAVKMMSSEDLDAFDIRKESEAITNAYGKEHAFGQGVLLARRLVQRGVKFVEVDLNGWDTHIDNHKGVAAQSAVLDRVLSTLLQDLKSHGLLDSTLVVVATEFGRTPEIDEFRGRSHHPLAFTCLLAGGGIRGGQIIGKSDEKGDRVIEDKVSVHDFHATIATAMGLDLQQQFSPGVAGQKFGIVGRDSGERGQVLKALL
jgi:hypothetical protein